MPTLLMPCAMLIHVLRAEETGVYFMDSTTVSVCHNRRINRNKVFAGLAERGKSSMGWFYGFKLHMVINQQGQIMAVKITKGNVDDRTPVADITSGLQGIVAADKGYISKKLFEECYRKRLKIITGISKTMKNILMPFAEKAILRKRFFIETQFDILKNIMTAQHTRHRSPISFLVNVLAAIIAHQITHPQMKTTEIIQN
jgi:transposase